MSNCEGLARSTCYVQPTICFFKTETESQAQQNDACVILRTSWIMNDAILQ